MPTGTTDGKLIWGERFRNGGTDDWLEGTGMAGGFASGEVTSLRHCRRCSEFGIAGQLAEWQIENIRLCARRFGIE